MKKMTMAAVMVLSSSAFADTFSQEIAAEMATVLQSDQVQDLLKREDGLGNLKSIQKVPTIKAALVSDYELIFESYSGLAGVRVCKATASLIQTTKKVMSVTTVSCK